MKVRTGLVVALTNDQFFISMVKDLLQAGKRYYVAKYGASHRGGIQYTWPELDKAVLYAVERELDTIKEDRNYEEN